jgi:DNA-binding protein H-NS
MSNRCHHWPWVSKGGRGVGGGGQKTPAASQPIALRKFYAKFIRMGVSRRPIITRCEQGPTMAKLPGMTLEGLMDLRKRVDEALHGRRAKLQKQLERLGVVGGARIVRGGGSALKGRKVPPKYRSHSGETWAGRGAKPRWLVAAIKRGRKLEDFLIDKSARKGRKRRR